ncbi:MAG TPA: UbiD family decarboxylase, partial [Dehalococcoidia bacterium]|nr:UbiD family decarboxylase [Dehalococcoidia bacterium]
MAFRDLREYIGKLEELGEVQPIEKEVDPYLEVGAVIRRSYDLRAPAPFFQKLKGYPAGVRVFGAPVAMSRQPGRAYARIATALGLAPEATYGQIVDAVIARVRDMRANPIKPVVVSREAAPCKENVLLGDEVDLGLFPAPVIHGGDGGGYIGTWHTVITKDPDTGWVNWCVCRLMVVDKNRLTGHVLPFQHIGMHYFGKYEPRGKPMPFAVAIGTEPVATMVSGSRLARPGEDEVDFVCALRGEPVELVPAETADLMVPAGAEVVLEGEMLPAERTPEGPFGEFPGYQASGQALRPVFRVKAITYRRDPILPHTCFGVPVHDGNAFHSVFRAATLQDFLERQGLPIRRVCLPPEAVGFLAAIATRVPYEGYPQQLANAVFGHPDSRATYYLIIVEEDVDVTDLGQVVWALATRCHPGRGVFVNDKSPGMDLVPFASA